MWQEVTYYLRTKNIEQATAAKQRIEQKQRDEVKRRKEANNAKWQTKNFDEQGENWIYVRPLVKRLAAEKSNSNDKNVSSSLIQDNSSSSNQVF